MTFLRGVRKVLSLNILDNNLLHNLYQWNVHSLLTRNSMYSPLQIWHHYNMFIIVKFISVSAKVFTKLDAILIYTPSHKTFGTPLVHTLTLPRTFVWKRATCCSTADFSTDVCSHNNASVIFIIPQKGNWNGQRRRGLRRMLGGQEVANFRQNSDTPLQISDIRDYGCSKFAILLLNFSKMGHLAPNFFPTRDNFQTFQQSKFRVGDCILPRHDAAGNAIECCKLRPILMSLCIGVDELCS